MIIFDISIDGKVQTQFIAKQTEKSMHDQRKSHLKFGKKSGKITMYAMMNKSYFNNISEHIGCPNKFKSD